MKGYTKNIGWIDGIKAFAIIAILLNHFVESFGGGPWFSNPSYNWPEFSERMATLFPAEGNVAVRSIKFLGWLGDMGPGVFFLLSGLTLTLSALNKPLKPVEFYYKRLLRIYPLYIVIHIIILVVAKSWFKWDIHFFSASTLLSLAGLRFTESLFFYINPSWWFIWVIIQMYLLFPFLLIFLKNKGVKTFLITTLSITILARVSGILGFAYTRNLYFWMTGIFAGTRLFEFTFGMYLGYLLFNNSLFITNLLSRRRRLFLISFCIYALGFIFSWTYIGSVFSNIFITIGLSGLFYSIFELVSANTATKNSLLWIGKNSFSVFLLHQPFMMYVSPLFKGVQKGLVLIIIIVLSFVAGYVIEKLTAISIKTIKAHKTNIQNFLNSKANRVLIIMAILLAAAVSFLIMSGFSSLDNVLKLLLFFLFFAIALTRISSAFTTSYFVLRFFDVVLVISLVISLVSENWLSTYWMLVAISLLPLIITYKLKYVAAILVTIFFLAAGIFIVENYLRNKRPVEVLKWGEYPVLQMDSVTGYSLIPKRTTHLRYNNYDYYVKTNSIGFTSPEIDLSAKAGNEKRVLILGDAFSMPEGLDYSSSYPYLLEQQLRLHYPDSKINIINAGVTGYGPNEEYAQLNEYIKMVKPDVVINQFFVNEFDDINVPKDERRTGIGFFIDKSAMKKYFGNDQIPAQLNEFAKKKLNIINKSYLYNKSLLSYYEKDSPYFNDTTINKVDTYFNEMNTLCSTNNAQYMVMYVPGQIEVSNPKYIAYYPYFENLKDTNVFNFNLPQKTTQHLCNEKGIAYLNTTEYLKSYPVQPLYFTESWHWNKDGHKAIAKYLFEYLINNKILLKIAP